MDSGFGFQMGISFLFVFVLLIHYWFTCFRSFKGPLRRKYPSRKRRNDTKRKLQGGKLSNLTPPRVLWSLYMSSTARPLYHWATETSSYQKRIECRESRMEYRLYASIFSWLLSSVSLRLCELQELLVSNWKRYRIRAGTIVHPRWYHFKANLVKSFFHTGIMTSKVFLSH